MAERGAIIIFVRCPVPGAVKTRLAASCGAEQACLLYRRMVEGLLCSLSGIEEYGFYIYYAADTDAHVAQLKEWLGSSYHYREQAEGDLAERQDRAIGEVFSEGHECVVLIGSDCPAITPQIIHQGFSSTKQRRLAIGPAHDGGYYLFASSKQQYQRAIFGNIAWSTPGVLAALLKNADSCGCEYDLLPTLRDVDTIDDAMFYGLI